MHPLNLLWVKVGGLWPLNTGGRLRSFHLIKELSRHHRVTVLTTHGPDDDPESLASEIPTCGRVVSVPFALPKRTSVRFAVALARSWMSPYPADVWKCRVPALRAALDDTLRHEAVDLCIADFLAGASNVPLGAGVPVVLFEHNVEYLIWKRLSLHEPSPVKRAALAVEWRKMLRVEADACKRADLTVAVSEPDARRLQALAPDAQIRWIPTGVDTAYFAPASVVPADATLVFTGSLDWYPNEDALLFFLHDILPLIRRLVPGATLTVVGRNPGARLRAAAAAVSGVRLTGTVDDVRPYVAPADVYIVPLRIGSGTRLKIFEALAMGKAVVSTPIGAEGLALTPNRHFLEADTPAAFADAVVSLLRDPIRRRALGQRGRHRVASRYSWQHVARAFEACCAEALRCFADRHRVRASVHHEALAGR